MYEGDWSIYHLHTCHPFIDCEIYFARKVVDVSDQGRDDLTHSWRCLRSCGIDDILGKAGIVAVGVF